MNFDGFRRFFCCVKGGVLGAKKAAASGVEGGCGSGLKFIDRLFRWGSASKIEEKGVLMGGNDPCRLGTGGIIVWGFVFVVDKPSVKVGGNTMGTQRAGA